MPVGFIEKQLRADETFSMFTDPVAAVTAAIAAQRAMTGAAWPGNESVRVRAALHTGQVHATSNGYVGLAVHQAARVSTTAHGGQTVVLGVDEERLRQVGPLARRRIRLTRPPRAGRTREDPRPLSGHCRRTRIRVPTDKHLTSAISPSSVCTGGPTAGRRSQ